MTEVDTDAEIAAQEAALYGEGDVEKADALYRAGFEDMAVFSQRV